MRIDRLATLYFFHPLRKLMRPRNEVRIPILMYHSISDADEKGIHPYFRTTTSPAVFAEQMRFLHDNGYSVISLNEAVSILDNGANGETAQSSSTAKKYVVLTFDDGFRDFHTTAFPVLKQYGFTATVFLATGFIGSDRRKRFKGKDCLLWDEVRELDRKGISFGSHTVNHPVLVELKKEEIEKEVRESKKEIEDNLGKTVQSFSYPYAFPDGDREFAVEMRNRLVSCRYENGVCTRIGTLRKNAGDAYFISRIPMNSSDDLALFSAKINGSYNWLQIPQSLYKRIKDRMA